MSAVVRRARPSDKGPLMEFIEKNWGGQDYIPRVWDDWIRDRRGRLFAVEVDGRPVGMNRVDFLEDGSAWLEGARVHPDFRGLGLASILGEKAIQAATKRKARRIRLTTNSRNRSSIRQVAKMGFFEVSRMNIYVPGKNRRFRRQSGVRKARMADIPRLTAAMLSSGEFKAGGGVYWDGFRAESLSPKAIRRQVLQGSVFMSDGAVAISKLGSEEGQRWRQVCFACGNPGHVKKLIKHAFSTGGGKGRFGRFLCAPQGSQLVKVAGAVGLVRWGSYILFERRSPNG